MWKATPNRGAGEESECHQEVEKRHKEESPKRAMTISGRVRNDLGREEAKKNQNNHWRGPPPNKEKRSTNQQEGGKWHHTERGGGKQPHPKRRRERQLLPREAAFTLLWTGAAFLPTLWVVPVPSLPLSSFGVVLISSPLSFECCCFPSSFFGRGAARNQS